MPKTSATLDRCALAMMLRLCVNAGDYDVDDVENKWLTTVVAKSTCGDACRCC